MRSTECVGRRCFIISRYIWKNTFFRLFISLFSLSHLSVHSLITRLLIKIPNDHSLCRKKFVQFIFPFHLQKKHQLPARSALGKPYNIRIQLGIFVVPHHCCGVSIISRPIMYSLEKNDQYCSCFFFEARI